MSKAPLKRIQPAAHDATRTGRAGTLAHLSGRYGPVFKRSDRSFLTRCSDSYQQLAMLLQESSSSFLIVGKMRRNSPPVCDSRTTETRFVKYSLPHFKPRALARWHLRHKLL